tara:strand:- start:4733 stop:5002 length:270 start_codon:yes stop_codon:yes gene_type:complete
MPAIQDKDFTKVCAQLASCLSISIASARRKVELAAVKEGVKDLNGRLALAEKLLKAAKSINSEDEKSTQFTLDRLLAVLAEDENFMIED